MEQHGAGGQVDSNNGTKNASETKMSKPSYSISQNIYKSLLVCLYTIIR